MKKPIEEICRVISSQEVLEDFEFEPLERTVHLAPTLIGRVFAIKGVASSDIDVVVTDDFAIPRNNQDVPVIIASKKTGKYDGSIRDRLLMRRFPGHQTRELTYGCLIADRYGSEIDLAIVSGDEKLWTATYRTWTHELTNILHAGDIVRWHWRRYYSFLSEQDICEYASGFGERVIGLTLSAANRLASRELYAMAKAAGWHKLTLREQSALGLQGQWHRDETVLKAREHGKIRAGVGEHTLLSASVAEHLDGWVDGRNPITQSKL